MHEIKGWTIAELGDEFVAVPVGENSSCFKGVIRLNQTGKVIWEGLTKGLSEPEIAKVLTDKYEELDTEKALEDVKSVIDKLRNEGIINN